MKTKLLKYCCFTSILFLFCGCKKYLDTTPDKSLVIISNLQDLQGLLDNFDRLNGSTLIADAVSSDDYYLTSLDYQAMSNEWHRNMYVWNPNNLWGEYTALINDWGQVYNNIYIANTVLLNIDKIPRDISNATNWDNVKGQAHFLRAYSLFKAATVFCLAYDENSSSTDLGLPLRLDPDLNIQSVRSSVKETYNQILTDAELASNLLTPKPLHVMRSSKPAAFALLAKVNLSMRNYENALSYANKCLEINNVLMDYNTLNASSTYPIGQYNKEVLYHTFGGGASSTPVNIARAKTDTTLLSLYEVNDLRKIVFFRQNADGTNSFRGSYNGTSNLFNGIAIDEIYLIKAECLARAGEVKSAMDNLNLLLVNRYKTGTYKARNAPSNLVALTIILEERRKELLMRGSRWIDIKRLNKEGLNIELKRHLNGQNYTLTPNDLRFALPIPEDIIQRSGMQQNPR